MSLAAIEQAIAFLSRTDLIATARQRPLPAGVTELLRISSGDHAALLAAQRSLCFSLEDVRHAAQFYVQQILFAPESDHYRVLGVEHSDAESKIKLHYRLLVRWLHPDKNTSDWEVVFSDRINRAWYCLRTSDRRKEYDLQLASKRSFFTDNAPNRELEPGPWRSRGPEASFLSTRTIKRLPVAMYCLLGLTALFALWWFSQLQPRMQTSVNTKARPESGYVAPSATSIQLETMPSHLAPTQTIESRLDIEPKISLEEKARIQNDAGPTALIMAEPIISTLPVDPQPKPVMPAQVQKIADPSNPERNSHGQKNHVVAKAAITTAAMRRAEKVDEGFLRKGKITQENTDDIPAIANAYVETRSTVNAAEPGALAEVKIAHGYDNDVRQFLQQFSRAYVEGNYFALHNLFTKDLSIIGAAPQRKVLHAYRDLFQASQRRGIVLEQVTWSGDEQHMVVNATYQTWVLPSGKTEMQSSHGSVRLDLRMENGELKIIRLRSEEKNG